MQTTCKQTQLFGPPTEIVISGAASGKKLPIPAKQLSQLLINPDHYIRIVKYADSTECILYQGNQNPVKKFSPELVKNLMAVFKQDKNGKITFNKNKIRQQDGRTFLKKLYKTHINSTICNL